MDNVEKSTLLGVQNYKSNLKEQVRLVQAKNPGTAKYNKLGQYLEQNQPANRTTEGFYSSLQNTGAGC